MEQDRRYDRLRMSNLRNLPSTLAPREMIRRSVIWLDIFPSLVAALQLYEDSPTAHSRIREAEAIN
jgi:hypothetical protein